MINNFYHLISQDFLSNQNLDSNSIQNKIFSIAKEEINISPQKMFRAIYLIILGKTSGPRLGPFIAMLDREWLLKRFNQILK